MLESEKQPKEMPETPLKFAANRGSLLNHHNYKIHIGLENSIDISGISKVQRTTILLNRRALFFEKKLLVQNYFALGVSPHCLLLCPKQPNLVRTLRLGFVLFIELDKC